MSVGPMEMPMNEQRLPLASGIGLFGALAGALGALTGRRRMALVAGIAAGGGAWMALRARHEADELEDRVTSMTDQIHQLEKAVAAQVQGRMASEEAVRSLTGQLADAERRAGDATDHTYVFDQIAEGPVSGGLTDVRTGLFNHDYFLVSLDSRIAAARRHLRPVAVSLLEVVRGREGDDRPTADPRLVADCLRETLRESDTATRLRDGRYGVVLEDTPENGAIWTMERIRRRLVEEDPELTMWAGVACYPAHAFDVAALIERAEQALSLAHDWHQDRIEVATGE